MKEYFAFKYSIVILFPIKKYKYLLIKFLKAKRYSLLMAINDTLLQAAQASGKNMSEIVTVRSQPDEGTRKWQLSGLDTIEEIRQRLKGNYFDIEKEAWIKVCDPWMNDEGIGRIASIMNNYINKNIQLSYFEPDVIENMTLGFAGELSALLQYYYDQFGIKKEYVGIIACMLVDVVYAALMRARFGKESQFIENTEQRRIIQTEGEQEKKSLMSKIPLLGGRI